VAQRIALGGLSAFQHTPRGIGEVDAGQARPNARDDVIARPHRRRLVVVRDIADFRHTSRHAHEVNVPAHSAAGIVTSKRTACKSTWVESSVWLIYARCTRVGPREVDHSGGGPDRGRGFAACVVGQVGGGKHRTDRVLPGGYGL
jgi:hypothetical protein